MPSRWPASLVFSVNCFAAAMLALLISLLVGLPVPYWAMTTAYIVSSPLAGATRSKAVYRVFGTVIGAAAAVIMVPRLVDEPLLLTLALSAWVGGCLAISLLDRSPRSYIVMLAGYTAAMIAFPSVNAPEAVWDTAVARVTEITLGIASATFTHSIFFPRSVGDVLRARTRRWLADADRWLLDCLAGASSERFETDRRHLAVDAVELQILATHLPFDTSHLAETTGTVRALLARMLTLIPLLSGVTDRRRALGGYSDPALERLLGDVAQWVRSGEGDEAAAGIRARLADFARDTRHAAWTDLLIDSLLTRLGEAMGALGECRSLQDHIDAPGSRLSPALRQAVSETPPSALGFHRDLFNALASGGAAAIAIGSCSMFWIYSGWADGAGAAVLTAVFCCLFSTQDRPVPAILRFGAGWIITIPLVALYMIYVLPRVDGFIELTLVLAPPLVGIGYFMASPRWGVLALSSAVGVCNALAIQESMNSDFLRFLNANIAQCVAVLCAVFFTATLRTYGADFTIRRLRRTIHGELARLAGARTPPDERATLARVVDQLALLTPRLGLVDRSGEVNAEEGLRGLRIAMNLAVIQNLRPRLERRPRVALARLLKTAAEHFRKLAPLRDPPSPGSELLGQIDRALSLLCDCPQPARTPGIAALVALRRNLYPEAPAYAVPGNPEPFPPAEARS